MLKYRGSRLAKPGFIGVTLIVLCIAVGLRPEQIASLATSLRYQALFTQVGGLIAGNDVTVSGIKVGTVTDIALDDGQALVRFTIKAALRLGDSTTAHIRTGSLLGQRVLTLEPAGRARLRPSDTIPTSRTSSPYSITDAVGDLTTDIAGTDTGTLNQSLDTLSATIDEIAPKLGPTFDGVTRLSRALNARNHTLGELFKNVRDVSTILSARSAQVNTLILDAHDLVDVLVDQRHAIVDLLSNTSALAKQLSGVIHDNEAKLAPTLEKLNAVTAILEKNRDNIAKSLPSLAQYELTSGELVSSGPYYQAMIANLGIPELLQPFLDYAFGFRRGPNRGSLPNSGARAGAPDAGPRAEIPFPVNGIPRPGERWGQ